MRARAGRGRALGSRSRDVRPGGRSRRALDALNAFPNLVVEDARRRWRGGPQRDGRRPCARDLNDPHALTSSSSATTCSRARRSTPCRSPSLRASADSSALAHRHAAQAGASRTLVARRATNRAAWHLSPTRPSVARACGGPRMPTWDCAFPSTGAGRRRLQHREELGGEVLARAVDLDLRTVWPVGRSNSRRPDSLTSSMADCGS